MQIGVFPNKILPVQGILTPEALYFVGNLTVKFRDEIVWLLANRRKRQLEIDNGLNPNFNFEARGLRNSEWKVAPAPPDFEDRRVEITGPASSRKMVINALNSGARVYMADAEDSEAPTLANLLNSQKNLFDAIRGTISFSSGDKEYKLNEKTAALMFRPRGIHLDEKHVFVDGESIPASIFDLGLYFYWNLTELVAKEKTPAIYWPKTEDVAEIRWLNKVLKEIEDQLGVPQSTIRVCVLIETIHAAFQMDEILYELKDRSLGLNCGRWDYMFSFIKTFHNRPEFILPDRSQLKMSGGFLKAYSELLVKTCHRRGAHAMGGMAAQIPLKNKEENEKAMAVVRADKAREVQAGHDGTWVAHPGLVSLATEIFDLGMPGPNQLHVLREDVNVTAEDLLRVPEGEITQQGLKLNVSEAVQYTEAYLRGLGCAVINNVMSDAATAEISRVQIMNWLCHRKVGYVDFKKILDEEAKNLISPTGKSAVQLLNKWAIDEMTVYPKLLEFLTWPAYNELLKLEN